MSWSLSLSEDCTCWNCPGKDVKIKSSVFSSRDGKFHYENTPIQYNGTLWLQKRKVSDEKMWSFLLFLLETEIVGIR